MFWCHVCKYEWQAFINGRRKQYKYPGQPGSSCPNCVGRVVNIENSFAAANPNLIEEWHPSKNLPDVPYNVPATGPRKFWWVCQCCEHEWEASLGSRSCGTGCPLCGKFENRKPSSDDDVWAKEMQKLVIKSKYVHHGK